MPSRRLLKSCAIPPASCPTASIFCAWRRRSLCAAACRCVRRSSGQCQGERGVDREHERSGADERVSPRRLGRRAEPLRGGVELAPDLSEDHERLVGDLVRLDLVAGFDRTKLPFENRRVLPLECQQPAQIGVDVGELEQVRLHVGRTPLRGRHAPRRPERFAASGSASQGRFCASERRDSICETSSCACFWRSPERSRARMAPSTARTITSPPTCMSTPSPAPSRAGLAEDIASSIGRAQPLVSTALGKPCTLNAG